MPGIGVVLTNHIPMRLAMWDGSHSGKLIILWSLHPPFSLLRNILSIGHKSNALRKDKIENICKLITFSPEYR